MRGTDHLALRDSLRRIVLECNQACMAIDGILREQDRDAAKVSRWPELRAPDPATLIHEVAIPEEIVDRIAECGE